MWNDQQSVVCVEVSGHALFDAGYDWGDKWVVERTKVVVDGVHRDKVVGNVKDFLQAVETADGLIGTGPWGWCLATPLTAGIHRVDVSVEKISGVIDTYAWTFELIDRR